MNNDLYPNNTRSQFKTFFNIHTLDYLPNESIEVAIKSITFDNNREETLLKDQLLGVRSNICEPIIRSSSHDKVISLFSVKKNDDSVVHIEFKNPTFFRTRKELLSRADFEIIDIEDDKKPNFKVGSPTFVQVVIRKEEIRMKPPFTIFLDSSCNISKRLYPENNNMEFTIELPERMDFRRNWTLALKSLHISNLFYNIHGEDCFYRFKTPYVKIEGKIPDGKYSTISSLIEALQSSWDSWKTQFPTLNNVEIPMRIVLEEGKVKIISIKKDGKPPMCELYLSPALAHILGFELLVEKGYTIYPVLQLEHIAPYSSNLNLLLPKNILICCDIADETIFGGEPVKLLRFITYDHSESSSISSYEFLQNEYIDLEIKHFTSIKIRICNVSGETIKCDSSIPSRLQILFVNV